MRYDTDKQQLLAFDKSSNFQFNNLNNLNGLNDAIQNAVNLILDYEKDFDKKSIRNSQVTSFKADEKYNQQVNYMNSMNNQQDKHQNYKKKQNNPPQDLYIQIPNEKPLYDMKSSMYEMQNKNNLNNQNDRNSNQIEKPMIKKIKNKINKNQQLDRNQRYVKRLICKTRKHERALKLRNHKSSGSNNYANFVIRNGYNMYNNDDNNLYNNQVVRYPIFVSDYDSDLIQRLYSVGNIFI